MHVEQLVTDLKPGRPRVDLEIPVEVDLRGPQRMERLQQVRGGSSCPEQPPHALLSRVRRIDNALVQGRKKEALTPAGPVDEADLVEEVVEHEEAEALLGLVRHDLV